MDPNEMAVKEINQYYVRRGGRSPLIKNYANTGDFAARMRKAMAAATAQTPQDVSDLRKDTSGVQEGASGTQGGSSVSGEDAGQTGKDFCCDTCLKTSQLTMQLWRSLYLRSALGGFSAGTGSLANLVTGTGSLGNLAAGAGSLTNLIAGTGALGNLNAGADALANLIAGTGSLAHRTGGEDALT